MHYTNYRWEKSGRKGDRYLYKRDKVTVAWISREGDRKYRLRHVGDMNHMTDWSENDKTFRSLKAAKAYAVAIITLEN